MLLFNKMYAINTNGKIFLKAHVKLVLFATFILWKWKKKEPKMASKCKDNIFWWKRIKKRFIALFQEYLCFLLTKLSLLSTNISWYSSNRRNAKNNRTITSSYELYLMLKTLSFGKKQLKTKRTSTNITVAISCSLI